jgi:hypothetical protein
MLAAALHFSGMLKRLQGAHAEAQACFGESLTLSTATGDRWLYGMALAQLGEVTHALGDDAEAVRLLNESVVLLRELDEHWSTLHALIGLGAATAAMGNFAESRAAYCEALATAWERQALAEVLAALVGLAQWAVQNESGDEALQAALATTLFALQHPSATQKTKDEARRLGTEIEARLAASLVEAAQATAQTVSLATMVTDHLAAGSP